MRRMGNLRKYMPVTFATMFIGTLAIAGIPPLSGFFSKDEILFRAFLYNKVVWVLAAATAMMTAFYMYRLVAMTFFGAYRGPAWEGGSRQSSVVGRQSSVVGHQSPVVSHQSPVVGHRSAVVSHQVAGHGAAGDHHTVAGHHDDHGGGHGHGAWHGPHESPAAMTFPLQALALGAVIAGFVGIPAALGGGNAIERFLEPSFTPEHVAAAAVPGERPSTAGEVKAIEHAGGAEEHSGEEASRTTELGLMLFSVLIAVAGIMLARKFYVTTPAISDQLAHRFAGAHRVLSNKYYVDEVYDATVISGTFSASRSLWTIDRQVVDGAVNGAGWLTLISSWFSGLTDKGVVDGVVNLVGSIVQECSHVFRRLQTGLVQNYALLMLFGIFAFVSIYLFMR
jgi:NADH-quinone oxidoreductase subunit L